jgi:fucose 4-O-acetylase-like acetyltransferase
MHAQHVTGWGRRLVGSLLAPGPLGALSSERSTWLDAIRGTAVILVVLHHATSLVPTADRPLPEWITAVDDALVPFRMPILMGLSGLLASRSIGRSPSSYFGARARSLGWPYLFWSVVTLVFSGTLSLTALVRVPVFSPTYLWYLWFLMAFSAAAFVLSRLRIPPLPVAILSLAVGEVVPDWNRLPRMAFLFAFFLFGWWLSGRRGRLLSTREASPNRVIRGLVVGGGGAAAVVAASASVAGHDVGYSALFAWAPAGLLTALVVAGRSGWLTPSESVRPILLSRVPGLLGRNSIVFYVTHLSCMYVVLWLLRNVSISVVPFVACVVLALGVGVLGSIVRTTRRGEWLFRWPSGRRRASPMREGACSSHDER